MDNRLLDHKYFKLMELIEQMYAYAKWKLEKDLEDSSDLKTTNPRAYDNVGSRDIGALEALQMIRDRARFI